MSPLAILSCAHPRPAEGAVPMLATPPLEARRGFALTLGASMRESTITGYLQHLDAYLRWCGARDPYERQTVLAYLTDVAARCSRPTLATYHKALRKFFRWCAAEDVCLNAMMGVEVPRVSFEEWERDAPEYTEADRDALLEVCPPWTWLGLRNRALIWWLWTTPLRSSELCRLRWDDIDWDLMEAKVRGKGGSDYIVNLTLTAADATHRYRRHCPHEGDDLWLTEKGRALTPHALALRRMAQRAGVKKRVYPHAFRHRFRVQAVMLGLSDVEVAKVMGWKTVRSGWRSYGAKLLAAQARAKLRERMAG